MLLQIRRHGQASHHTCQVCTFCDNCKAGCNWPSPAACAAAVMPITLLTGCNKTTGTVWIDKGLASPKPLNVCAQASGRALQQVSAHQARPYPSLSIMYQRLSGSGVWNCLTGRVSAAAWRHLRGQKAAVQTTGALGRMCMLVAPAASVVVTVLFA